MPILNLKPSHKAVKAYYRDLETLKGQAEQAQQASLAFIRLLTHCAKQVGWTFMETLPDPRFQRNTFLKPLTPFYESLAALIY